MSNRVIVALISIAAAILFATTQLTFFVVQPIGAVPEGRTVVIWRLTTMKFIDSADALCERQTAGVNLLCRGAVLAKIANEDEPTGSVGIGIFSSHSFSLIKVTFNYSPDLTASKSGFWKSDIGIANSRCQGRRIMCS